MISTGDIYKCCGCAACYAVCGHNAIVMVQDSLGFLYPEIDPSKCVGCGLCERVCGFKKGRKQVENPICAYAARHKNLREIESSRSGAAFIALSDYVLESGGVVYGAGYGPHFSVIHKRAENKPQRNEFKGSKYAQSCMLSIYKSIVDDLKSGKKVMFSGTPCQTAAIYEYVPKTLWQTLFVVDVICHGVSSPRVWDDYLSYLEKKVGKPIKSVNFRDKLQFGWSGLHKESFVFSDNIKRTFQYTYYNDLLIRPSCSACPYASLNRPSDITIGDFWGWKDACPSFNTDDKGCSLVLVNSEKGEILINAVSQELHMVQVPIDKCMQPNLQRPTPESALRSQFELDYTIRGFEFVMYKYGEVGLKYHCLRFIRYAQRQLKRFFK